MNRLLKSTSLLLGTLLLSSLAACTSSTEGSASDVNGSPSETVNANGDPSKAPNAPVADKLAFKASNVDLSKLDAANIGDMVLSGGGCVIETESKLISCDDDRKASFQIVTLPDASRLAVYVVKSLRIEASTVVRTNGHLPLVFVALEDITMLGSIDVPPGTTGGAFNAVASEKGQGPGGGTAGDEVSRAGGGGTFCGLGGKGGTEGTPALDSPAAYGTAELTPLVGGSAGGSGSLVSDGKGGGAVQLVAGGAIVLKAGAYINVGGAGGTFGGSSVYHQSAGGAGSGGSILLEASTVTIEGTLAANGGGGGQGSGDMGEPGRPSDTAAEGGHKTIDATVPAVGGSGSSLAVVDGQPGTYTIDFPASGGGGGAGRVRINTKSGTANVSGVVSPGLTTTCATQGVLAAK